MLILDKCVREAKIPCFNRLVRNTYKESGAYNRAYIKMGSVEQDLCLMGVGIMCGIR